MAKFVLSAFADEASSELDVQMKELIKENITLIELRGVDGVNCADLSCDDAKIIHEKLQANGIGLSALGSPYGKIGIDDPFEPHLEKLKNSLEVCNIFGCNRIRMFSFYLPKNADPKDYRSKVIDRLGRMIDAAGKADVVLMHENEKGIYGDTDVRCMDLYETFGGKLGIAFDPANYIQCGVDPLSAYKLQKSTISYFHMKDALKADGSVVRVGNGDGSVPQILKDVYQSRDDDVILTVEPHLHVFGGLTGLQGEQLLHKESFPDSITAFHGACEAVHKVVNELEGK